MAIFNFRWPGKTQQEDARRTIHAPRSNPTESVQAMRSRARHRLIGATVLVLAAIIGFPMLFDTQPRPVSVNASIEIPDRDKVAALVLPPPGTPVDAQVQPLPDSDLDMGDAVVPVAEPAGTATPATPASDSQSANQPADKPVATAAKPQVKPIKPDTKPVAKPEAKPEQKTKDSAKRDSSDAERIRALMEGRSTTALASAAKPETASAPAASARYVVQVGAFAEADKAAQVLAKLQLAGVAAFTQTVKTPEGNRTRVRVGPFGSKEEADRTAAKVRAQGLSASLVPV